MSETLHDALVDEIKDLYNADKQLLKALSTTRWLRTAPASRGPRPSA